MAVFREFIHTCRAEHVRLGRLLARWRESGDVARLTVLPLTPPPEEPFRLARQIIGLRAAFPEVGGPPSADDEAAREASAHMPSTPDATQASEGDGRAETGALEADVGTRRVRKRMEDHLALLGIEIAGLNGALLEELADIVLDGQLSRTLLLPEDSFHVSSVSVMGAIALANLAWAAGGERRAERGAARSDLISLPLRVAALHVKRFRPGDLLFWELATRSVAAAVKREGWSKAGRAVLERHLPVFLSHSTLAKLDLAFDLHLSVLRASDYRTWPGLAALIGQDGAGSIRRNVVGRLALHCARKPQLATAIVGRWLEALTMLGQEQPGRALPVTLLAARFFWELLDRKEEALAQMARQGRAAAPILAMIGGIEELRNRPAPSAAAQQLDYRCLCDITCCLDNYPVYRGLRELGLGMATFTAGATAPGAESEATDTPLKVAEGSEE